MLSTEYLDFQCSYLDVESVSVSRLNLASSQRCGRSSLMVIHFPECRPEDQNFDLVNPRF
jgi:hypothetical protein